MEANDLRNHQHQQQQQQEIMIKYYSCAVDIFDENYILQWKIDFTKTETRKKKTKIYEKKSEQCAMKNRKSEHSKIIQLKWNQIKMFAMFLSTPNLR